MKAVCPGDAERPAGLSLPSSQEDNEERALMTTSSKTHQPEEKNEPSMANEETGRLLTTIEAAQEIDRSPQQISLLIRQGKLPAQRRGRDWLIKESDLRLILNIPKDRPVGTGGSQQGKLPSAAAGKIATALRRGGSGRKGKG